MQSPSWEYAARSMPTDMRCAVLCMHVFSLYQMFQSTDTGPGLLQVILDIF
jgi:hypothetical protein